MLVRRRYYIWLIKAYINRWKKTIFYSVLTGVVIALIGYSLFLFTIQPLFQKKTIRIGYAGAYTLRTIPDEILKDVSYGLTGIDANDQVTPKAASSWEISNGGKEFIFHIKPHQYFHDGEELTSQNVELNYQDITKKIIDKYTVSYSLGTPYSPFLVAAAKPLFIKNTIGLGQYKITSIDLNAGYLHTIVLQKNNNVLYKKIITFYPTVEALKVAFALGEIDVAKDLTDLQLDNNTNFANWKNVAVNKNTDYNQLVVLFYNNNDNELSNKKLRQALDYAIPDTFTQGERAYSPIPPSSIYFSRPPNFGISDLDIAKQLLKSAQVSSNKVFHIETTDDFVPIAQIVQKRWKELGVSTKIDTIRSIDDLPPNFQILLYQIRLPKDPDQYTLWHSDQINNIRHFKNLRIDKLLEDGRVTFDLDKRKTIYADFQKYLIDDVPASFLYFPYFYTISRK